HGPAGVQVGLVVLVFPGGAAAVADIAGDGHQAVAMLFLAVGALHQFGVPRGAAPVALDAGAGIAQFHLFQFALSSQVFGHRDAVWWRGNGAATLTNLPWEPAKIQ